MRGKKRKRKKLKNGDPSFYKAKLVNNTTLAYLGVSHIHNILIALHTLHNIEAIAVQHFGL